MSRDRDAYELDETPARKHALALVLAGKLTCPRGADPVMKTGGMVAPVGVRAYRDLVHAGLVIGDVITGRGYRAAEDWGLNPSATFRKGK